MTFDVNPGSYAARRCGCTCPAADNMYGLGIVINSVVDFVIGLDCPIHQYRLLAVTTVTITHETDPTPPPPPV